MTLENLIGISLEQITPDAVMITRLLQAAERNLADAQVENISAELRFDAAYKAIMQLANAALQANGYRTHTGKPGHHMTLLQSLGKTVGVDKETVIFLDALRKQRNVVDYSGDLVSGHMVRESIDQGEALYRQVHEWLTQHKPELLEQGQA